MAAGDNPTTTRRDRARKTLGNVSELDLACSEENAPAVKTLLLESSKRNSLQRREIASTPDKEDVAALLPIHTACQRREDSREIIELLLDGGHYSISDKTVNGDTALHVACISGNLEAVHALFSFSDQSSIRECLRHQNKDGDNPLHLASKSGKHEITSLLLKHFMPVDYKHIVSKTNRLGETCLGLAIEAQDWMSVILLLKYLRSNPATLCQDFMRNFPEYNEIENQALEHDPTNVFLLGDTKSSKTTLISTLQYSAQSTLSKIITAIPFWGNRIASESYGKCCIVPSTVEYRKQDHKCPFVFYDVGDYRSYAQEAIFSCSRKPLEALYIITVDVRKTDIEDSVAYWLCFLNHLLATYRHCVDESPMKTSQMKVKVAIALTFCDLVPSSRLQKVNKIDFSSLLHSNGELDIASQFKWCGNFNLNARKHSSLGMPHLISMLHGHCCFESPSVELDESQSLLAQTYILAGLLLKEYFHTAVTTFSDVMGLVQHSDNRLCKMLPKQDCEIERLCHNLQLLNSFKILSFDNQNRKFSNWYIVLDYKYLLKSVEEALEDLAQYSENGMVTRQQIKSAFSFPPDFIVNFLEHLKLCEYVSSEGLESMKRSIRFSLRSRQSNRSSNLELPIVPAIVLHGTQRHRRTKSDSDTLDTDSVMAHCKLSMSTRVSTLASDDITSPGLVRPDHLLVGRPDHDVRKLASKTPSPVSSQHSSKRSTRSTVSSREVPHYFFPSLIPSSQPEELWEEDSSEYSYGFSWSLVPHEGDRWFLSPKFITIILFRLLFSFAPRPPNPKSFVDRLCNLWNRGIRWSDPQGARVCVAISDENKVTLSMQCLQKYEVSCLSIRNEIMADIKQKLTEIHPNVHPRELFTPFDGINVFPVVDPLKSYATFDKKEILRAIMEKRPVICTEGKHHKSLDSLLHFEPLCYLSPPLLRDLFDEEIKHTQVSDDFCMQLAMNLSTKWTYLADHFLDTVIKKYYIDSLTDDVTQSLKKAPHHTAMDMLTYLKELDYKEENDRVDTYMGLQRSLFEISIFSPDEVTKEWEGFVETTS